MTDHNRIHLGHPVYNEAMALEMTVRYGHPDIVNPDQSSQLTAGAFTEAVLGRDIQLSMDSKVAWRDNVFVERVWRSIKYEEVYLRAYESVSHARRSIGDYIELYNRKRPIRAWRIRRRMRHTSRRYQIKSAA